MWYYDVSTVLLLWQALKKKDERYSLIWPEKSEFVRMAARFGATIVPFGAVGAEDWINQVCILSLCMGVCQSNRLRMIRPCMGACVMTGSTRCA